MAIVIVIDDAGNERMHRDTQNTMIPPPPGWDEAKWAGKLVEDLIRSLSK